MPALTTDLNQVAERPGARARIRFVRMSASKVRVVMNLIRGKRVEEALEILQFTERLAAQEVAKALRSAVANAAHNEDIPESELYVSVAFADEGPTIKRFRPRARGRAGRINKQTCHITIEVARMTEAELDELRSIGEAKAKGRQRSGRAAAASSGGDRAARVAKSRAADNVEEETPADEVDEEATASSNDKEASNNDEAKASDEVDDSTDAVDDVEATEAGEEE